MEDESLTSVLQDSEDSPAFCIVSLSEKEEPCCCNSAIPGADMELGISIKMKHNIEL